MVQNIGDMEYEWFVGKTVLNRATLDNSETDEIIRQPQTQFLTYLY